MKKLLSVTFIVCLAAGIGAWGRPASAQVPLPPLPEQAQPAANIVSPLSFQACLAPSTAIGLVQAGQAIGGVPLPVPPSMVLDPVLNSIVFDVACTYFSPKIVPPTCDVDSTIYGSLPAATNVPLPASIIATELIALEQALGAYGAPVGDQASSVASEQFGCRQ
jgi:hypothetical protein